MHKDVIKNYLLPYLFCAIYGDKVWEPLKYFCKVGDLTSVKNLVRCGVHLYIHRGAGLKGACSHDQLHIVKYLQKRPPSLPTAQHRRASAPINPSEVIYALIPKERKVLNHFFSFPGVKEWLHQRGVNVEHAVYIGTVEGFRYLEQHSKAFHRFTESEYKNALTSAVTYNHLKLTRYILMLKKIIPTREMLEIACQRGYVEIFKLLSCFFDVDTTHGISGEHPDITDLIGHPGFDPMVCLCKDKDYEMIKTVGSVSVFTLWGITLLCDQEDIDFVLDNCKITKNGKECKKEELTGVLSHFVNNRKRKRK